MVVVGRWAGRRGSKEGEILLEMSSYKCCICFTRKFACSAVAPPSDVRNVFAAYAGGAAYMGPDHLRRFLADEQGEADATLADAERIIERVRGRHHHLPAALARPGITLEDFFHFLFADDLNPPLVPQVHHDMKLPLSHYYIYTGHNSYLTGNQLSSKCSDAPIIKALKRGVRVIELDMWPNSAKDNVNILHGRTLTSPVEMIKCLKSIKEHAFVASPYPVVVTLEDHLTSELQSKVAKMITETFGDMLYYPETDCTAEFPSPEALKHRVIISTKPPKEFLDKDKENNPQKGKAEPEKVGKNSREGESWGDNITDLKALHASNDELQGTIKIYHFKPELNASSHSEKESDDSDDEDDDDDQNQLQRQSEPDYRGIITIHAGKPKGRLRDALNADSLYVRRLSLSEPRFEKATESHGPELVRFTRKNILRIYPRGTRFDSSNYNPLLGWIHGAQMVAFNMQGYGRSLWLMQGLFRANGSCGYVRKPDFLMKNDPTGDDFYPKASLPVKTTLKVKVYLGDGWRMDFSLTHFDSYSPPDFYTKVGIAGVPADTKTKKTKIKHDNWAPVWEEEFSFPLTVPELALLRIEVHEYDLSEKNDFAGQTCLPVWELKQGIRCVPLYDRKGDKYKSVRLLIHFQFV